MVNEEWVGIVAYVDSVVHISELSPSGDDGTVWNRVAGDFPVDGCFVVLKERHCVCSVDPIEPVLGVPTLVDGSELGRVVEHGVGHHGGCD